MTDFHNSPSGLDPKTMKPWAEMTEVERLEYQDLVARRTRIRYSEYKYKRWEEDHKADKAKLRTQAIGLICFILVCFAMSVYSSI